MKMTMRVRHRALTWMQADESSRPRPWLARLSALVADGGDSDWKLGEAFDRNVDIILRRSHGNSLLRSECSRLETPKVTADQSESERAN
jgi:hypothetical protein